MKIAGLVERFGLKNKDFIGKPFLDKLDSGKRMGIIIKAKNSRKPDLVEITVLLNNKPEAEAFKRELKSGRKIGFCIYD